MAFKLKDLRDLSVVVFHPPDRDGQALLDQLTRIGCRAEILWPPSRPLPASTEIVFAGVFFDTQRELKSVLRKFKGSPPTIIAIVNYENPAMLQIVLELDAYAVISKPIKEFGMLTNLVLARSKWEQVRQLSNKNNRLEKKLLAQKKIADAKRIIMDAHAVNEQEAYSILRSEAMTKRVSIEEMAITFINANNLLSKRKTNI
ncbi:MAG: ANTAR domain-containing protein [Roseibium sp.]|uniref:ANTAR domain-containing response regulator n=1 Tax=Roseibium sp. TaxID=1936156 RepID=UPI003D9C21AE